MRVIVCKYLIPKGYKGMAIYPFILAKNERVANDLVFINHESIHLQQQKELWILPFFIWYLFSFIVNLFKYGNWNKAYLNIIFEREAYTERYNLLYLETRRRFNFKDY